MDEHNVASDPSRAEDTKNEWPQPNFWRILRVAIATFALLALLIGYFEIFQPGLREPIDVDSTRPSPMLIIIVGVVFFGLMAYLNDVQARQAKSLEKLEGLPLMGLLESMFGACFTVGLYFGNLPMGCVVLAMALSVAYLFLVVRWTVRMGPRALSLPDREPPKRCGS